MDNISMINDHARVVGSTAMSYSVCSIAADAFDTDHRRGTGKITVGKSVRSKNSFNYCDTY